MSWLPAAELTFNYVFLWWPRSVHILAKLDSSLVKLGTRRVCRSVIWSFAYFSDITNWSGAEFYTQSGFNWKNATSFCFLKTIAENSHAESSERRFVIVSCRELRTSRKPEGSSPKLYKAPQKRPAVSGSFCFKVRITSCLDINKYRCSPSWE